MGRAEEVLKRPYGAYYATAESSFPTAVGVQPELG